MNLEQKIEHVLQRVKDGYFDQSMPPDETDIEMVLIDCLKEIKRLNGQDTFLVKKDTKTVVAIENMVEQQVEASGISEPIHRLDGWKILEAIEEEYKEPK